MFQSPNFNQLSEQVKSATSADVEHAINGSRLTLDDLAALISPAAEPFLQQMALKSAAITLARFGRTTQLYAPIYVSNYCTNRCAYCGFSADNRIKRKCLTIDEAEKEAMILHDRGFQHILLVSGEAENAVDVEYMEALALRLRNNFAAVSIEIQPMSTEHYHRLFLAGITAVAVYQETYDRDMYKQVHLSGKKSDFDYRLETP
ncbi:MAG: radical SAM protein, partial [Desulfocapsa sp.]|nr:radical SAM protein [Desulfocapsa sp.]